MDQVNISNYATFAGNPIFNADILGNVVQANQEANQTIQDGLKRTLGETEPDANGNTKAKGPIGYDDKTQLLTYDENADLSGFNDEQLAIIGRYKELIQSQSTIVNVEMVDFFKDDAAGTGQTLEQLKDVGVARSIPTGSYKFPNDPRIVANSFNVQSQIINVAIARNPQTQNAGGSADRYTPAGSETPGLTSLHEIAGHAYGFLHTTVMYDNNDRSGNMSNRIEKDKNNRGTEYFMDKIVRPIFKMNDGTFLRGKEEHHPRLTTMPSYPFPKEYQD